MSQLNTSPSLIPTASQLQELAVSTKLEELRCEWEFEMNIPRKHVLERAYNSLARAHGRKTRIWFDLHNNIPQHNMTQYHPREN